MASLWYLRWTAQLSMRFAMTRPAACRNEPEAAEQAQEDDAADGPAEVLKGDMLRCAEIETCVQTLYTYVNVAAITHTRQSSSIPRDLLSSRHEILEVLRSFYHT